MLEESPWVCSHCPWTGLDSESRVHVNENPGHIAHVVPVRLCCGQRHEGAMCPDGKVMCQLCFERFEVKDLNPVANNLSGDTFYEDVCKSCAEKDGRTEPKRTKPVIWGAWLAAGLVLFSLGYVGQPPVRYVEWLGAVAAILMAAWLR